MKDLVSVIIPVHNSEKYLEKCLESVLNGNYKNIEVIAVENGSIDYSPYILEKYNDKIKTITIKKASISLARNAGIEAANGEYITFVDSDDSVLPNYIEELVKKQKETKADLVVCNHYELHEENNKKEECINYPYKDIEKEEILNNLYKFNYAPWHKLYKTEIIKANKIIFPMDMKYEDVPFVLEYLIHTKNIAKVEKPLYNYYIHKESEQTTVDERIFDIIKVANLFKDLLSHELIENLYVLTLTRYSLKTRYMKDSKLRRKFISAAYQELNNNFKNWKKCDYIKELPLYKRIIVTSKILTKLYTKIYNMLIY